MLVDFLRLMNFDDLITILLKLKICSIIVSVNLKLVAVKTKKTGLNMKVTE